MSSEEVLSCLSSGEWVETGLVCDALGITFSEGFRRFDFCRTAEWWSLVGCTEEERSRYGQKLLLILDLRNFLICDILKKKSEGGTTVEFQSQNVEESWRHYNET